MKKIKGYGGRYMKKYYFNKIKRSYFQNVKNQNIIM